MTKLKYLENTYLFEYEVKIIEVGENENGSYIILDETIFYPQGGGQPCDIGEIIICRDVDLSHLPIKINNVRLDENGVVYHYMDHPLAPSLVRRGDNMNLKVKLKIDKSRRIINAKNHSAGHLIDIAMKNVGLDYLIPTKGLHFQGQCNVEYIGVLKEDKDEIIKKLNLELERLISEDIKVIVNDEKLENISSPTGKKPRFVAFEKYKNFGCGCGGTHINSSKEIGTINIKKIKAKKGNLKVSYEVV